MIEIDSMLKEIKKKRTGNENIVTLSNDRGLQNLASMLTDELDTDPPILTDRGGLRSAIEVIRSQGREPLVLLWSTEFEEFGIDEGLQIFARGEFSDPESIFGRPTLGLVSKHGPFWDRIPQGARAVYDEKYSKTATDYIKGLRSGGLSISSSLAMGEIYSSLGNGEADIGIGMIGREELLTKSGSWPVDRISESVPVLAEYKMNNNL
jgi:hypothetical protein